MSYENTGKSNHEWTQRSKAATKEKIAAKNTKITKIMARELARMNREDDNH